MKFPEPLQDPPTSRELVLPSQDPSRTWLEIRGVSFSEWRAATAPVRLPPEKKGEWVWSVGIGVAGTCSAILRYEHGLTQLGTQRILEFFSAIMQLVVTMMVAASFLWMRKLFVEKEPRRKRDPSEARALVDYPSRGSSRGSDVGDLWVRGPWLCFDGDGSAFQLARRDFTSQTSITNLLTRGKAVRLQTLEGLSPFHLKFGTLEHSPGFCEALAVWEASPEPAEPSLFPPAIPRYPVDDGDLVWSAASPFLKAGIVFAALCLCVPKVRDHGAIVFAVTGSFVLFGAIVTLAVWYQLRSKRVFENEIQALSAH